SSASRRAIPQAIERLLATPRTRPRLPSNLPTARESNGVGYASPLRRAIALSVLAAALLAATPTGAALRPIKRSFGETTLPRLRAGTIQVPAGHASGRVRVIATLKLPPLAAAFGSRTLAAVSSTTRLDVRTAS